MCPNIASETKRLENDALALPSHISAKYLAGQNSSDDVQFADEAQCIGWQFEEGLIGSGGSDGAVATGPVDQAAALFQGHPFQ